MGIFVCLLPIIVKSNIIPEEFLLVHDDGYEIFFCLLYSILILLGVEADTKATFLHFVCVGSKNCMENFWMEIYGKDLIFISLCFLFVRY